MLVSATVEVGDHSLDFLQLLEEETLRSDEIHAAQESLQEALKQLIKKLTEPVPHGSPAEEEPHWVCVAFN